MKNFAFLIASLFLAVTVAVAPARAEVIDDIAIESRGETPKIKLRLTGPVRYLRHFPAEQGEIVVVMLEALAPEAFGPVAPAEEVRRSRGAGRVPAFTARVSRDPACAAAARPLCIILAFEAPVRYRIRLGRDRRSVLLELLARESAS